MLFIYITGVYNTIGSNLACGLCSMFYITTLIIMSKGDDDEDNNIKYNDL